MGFKDIKKNCEKCNKKINISDNRIEVTSVEWSKRRQTRNSIVIAKYHTNCYLNRNV